MNVTRNRVTPGGDWASLGRSCGAGERNPELTLSAGEPITACLAPSELVVTFAEGGLGSAGSAPNATVWLIEGSSIVHSTVSPTLTTIVLRRKRISDAVSNPAPVVGCLKTVSIHRKKSRRTSTATSPQFSAGKSAEGMPVHRHLHGRMGSVYASKAELKEWARTRSIRTEQENATSEATTNAPARQRRPLETLLPRRRFLVPIAAAAAALTIGASLWFEEAEHLWRNPIVNARVQVITDFDAVEQAATVSRDGHFVAFLSDRDGQMDVWLTQVGSGQFHNLTRGSVPDLVNPSVRTLGFSPDGSLVTFWVRKQNGSGARSVSGRRRRWEDNRGHISKE